MDFIKAKDTYRENAVIQSKMAKKLIQELKLKCGFDRFDNSGGYSNSGGSCDFKTPAVKNVSEIGSGTGLLTDEIVKNINFDKLFLNDLTENFTGCIPFKYYKGDILSIKIEENFNLITSNAVFQWIDDKEKLFNKLFNLLNRDGILAFTTFGKENFNQIKDTIGFSLNYTDLTPIIEKAGFKILYFEEELETLYFKDVRNILEHIKLTGVGTNANCLWTKNKYEIFKQKYLEKFSDNNGVELTYHPLYFICRK